MAEWTDSSTEVHLHNYDGGEKWHVETYDRKSAGILAKLGATSIPTAYDGACFDCTPQQAIEYIAALHGLNVEFRSRKKAVLSPEQLAAKRNRMLQLNAARMIVSSTMNG